MFHPIQPHEYDRAQAEDRTLENDGRQIVCKKEQQDNIYLVRSIRLKLDIVLKINDQNDLLSAKHCFRTGDTIEIDCNEE
jgi:hypothetical protein